MFNQLLINSIIAGSTYTLIALSFSLIYSTTKFFHFAHGAVYTFCPYFAYLFTIIFQIPLLISIPLAIVSSAVVGILTELLIYKPLRRKGTTPLILLLSSLGIYIRISNNCFQYPEQLGFLYRRASRSSGNSTA